MVSGGVLKFYMFFLVNLDASVLSFHVLSFGIVAPCCVLLLLLYSVHRWWCLPVRPIFTLNAKTCVTSASNSSGNGCLQPCTQYAAAWMLTCSAVLIAAGSRSYWVSGCARFSVCCSLKACGAVCYYTQILWVREHMVFPNPGLLDGKKFAWKVSEHFRLYLIIIVLPRSK
jgi:hypothetical protein